MVKCVPMSMPRVICLLALLGGLRPADAATGHFGLQGVRERIRKLHGTVVLESAPGAGTKATVEIPTRTKESPDE